MEGRIGPYEIRGELGRGAMAIVWRAWDTTLEREIALKVPVMVGGPNAPSADEMATRFVKEGKAAARLNHPGIVAIHSADVYDGQPVIVMELIEGRTLSQVIAGGPLSPDVVGSITDQLLDAVGYAHSKGIVHRDIKPDNVFVLNDGRVKLADFGIAQLDSGGTMTQAGAIMGTPGYMSPEQVMGKPVDGRTDIYAIGVLAWEMLAGRNPFGADEGGAPTAVMFRVVQEMPTDVAEIAPTAPPALMQAIRVAMAKEPEQRFTTAEAMRSALHGGEIVTGGGSGASSGSTTGAVPVWQGAPTVQVPARSSSPTWMPYAIVAGVGVLVIGALFFFSGSGSTAKSAGGSSAIAAPKPTVSISSPSPGAGLKVGSAQEIDASVSGQFSGTVVFMVNGAEVGTDASAPYTASYTPSSAGALNVSAKVVLPDGTEVSSDPVAMTAAAADSGSGGSSPSSAGSSDAASEAQVRQMIQDWKAAWESMDLNSYLSYYDTSFHAYAPKNRDYNAWVDWKRGVFAGYSRQQVTISDMKVNISGTVAYVTFHQLFQSDSKSSSKGYSDSGQKKMRIENIDGNWRITQEDWVAD